MRRVLVIARKAVKVAMRRDLRCGGALVLQCRSRGGKGGILWLLRREFYTYWFRKMSLIENSRGDGYTGTVPRRYPSKICYVCKDTSGIDFWHQR
jgi:hypothetical protein